MPKHPLNFVQKKGLLAESLGLTHEQSKPIEDIVERALSDNWNLRNLLQTIGDMDISDELWANFLYTYGYWDGGRQ